VVRGEVGGEEEAAELDACPGTLGRKMEQVDLGGMGGVAPTSVEMWSTRAWAACTKGVSCALHLSTSELRSSAWSFLLSWMS